MKLHLLTRLAVPISAALLMLASCQETGPLPSPDEPDVRVFTGGMIHTGNRQMPQAAMVLVDTEGRILRVIDPETAAATTLPANAEVIDLGGAVMFPGFVDAHAHLSGIGERELRFDLSGTASVAELVVRVQAELSGVPAGRLLVGRGWIETGWPEGRMPVAADIDPVSPDNPVLLTRADGHALLANSAALAAAGIDASTADPDGGRIERDADGRATGLLIDTAMALVAPLVSAPTEEDVKTALAVGAEVYAQRGWTGVHNMSVTADEARLLQSLDQAGDLPLRVYDALVGSAFDLAASRAYSGGHVQNRAVKLYMDGALGSRGAQLIAPYSDRPGESGLSLTSDSDLRAFMQRAAQADVQLAIHAIGDLANRRILNACKETGLCEGRRWRIEHAQVIAPEDLARLAEADLIASMQPSHAIGDLFFAPARLGPNRLAGAYAWRDLLDAGTVIAGGSDAPVEVGSPLIEFYAAVARASLTGEQGEGWHPEQAVTRQEALAMFTRAPAFASFQEDELGMIAEGHIADFTVFDRDLMTIPADEILKARAVMTIVGGKVVWSAANE